MHGPLVDVPCGCAWSASARRRTILLPSSEIDTISRHPYQRTCRVNRFYGLAIALLIFAGALAAILLTDVAQTRDKVTIELALKALATAATVGSVVATAIARKKQQQEQAATPAPLSVHLQDGLVQGYTGERMGERQSLVQYVDQMRASLDLQQAQF